VTNVGQANWEAAPRVGATIVARAMGTPHPRFTVAI
jgi:hypothetical protein